jgi:hypothetical protein
MSNVSNQSSAFQPMTSLVGQVIAAKRPVNTILYTRPNNAKSIAQAKMALLQTKF